MFKHITDEQKNVRRVRVRANEVVRRVSEGSISFAPTMLALQAIIEGKHEPETLEHQTMRQCSVMGGSRCSICQANFADGDDMCVHGHQLGQSYLV